MNGSTEIARPIGGLFSLGLLDIPPVADSVWQAWCGNRDPAVTAWTARAALAQLINATAPQRVWLPAYSCPQLASVCPEPKIRFYPLDQELSPDLPFLRSHIHAGDLVLVTDYFGWPPNDVFVAFAAATPDVIWVEDRAHCLLSEEPPWGSWILYSPRKLLGVADGGLLLSRDNAEVASSRPGATVDFAVALPELMRFEDGEETRNTLWHAAFRTREAAFSADALPLSRLTAALLRRIPIRPLAEARQRNYAFLAGQLAPHGAWQRPALGIAPFGFVIAVKDAAALGAALAAERLFCSRHWPTLPVDAAEFPFEHSLTTRLLTLPCDHRYDIESLTRLVEAVQRLAAPP